MSLNVAPGPMSRGCGCDEDPGDAGQGLLVVTYSPDTDIFQYYI